VTWRELSDSERHTLAGIAPAHRAAFVALLARLQDAIPGVRVSNVLALGERGDAPSSHRLGLAADIEIPGIDYLGNAVPGRETEAARNAAIVERIARETWEPTHTALGLWTKNRCSKVDPSHCFGPYGDAWHFEAGNPRDNRARFEAAIAELGDSEAAAASIRDALWRVEGPELASVTPAPSSSSIDRPRPTGAPWALAGLAVGGALLAWLAAKGR